MNTTCVIYARTSINPLCDGLFANSQVERLLIYAEANNIEVKSIVIGEGECDGQNRISIQKLYQEVEKYHPDIVLVHTIDRLSQNAYQFKAIAEQLRLRGTAIRDIHPCLLEVSSVDIMARLPSVDRAERSKRRCCIYARIGGTGTEFDKSAMENQLKVLRQLAKDMNLQVVKEIAVFESGTDHKRSSIQELLKDGKQQAYDCVLVFDLNRLARTVVGIQYVAHALKQVGIELHTPSGEEAVIPFVSACYSAFVSGGDAVGPGK